MMTTRAFALFILIATAAAAPIIDAPSKVESGEISSNNDTDVSIDFGALATDPSITLDLIAMLLPTTPPSHVTTTQDPQEPSDGHNVHSLLLFILFVVVASEAILICCFVYMAYNFRLVEENEERQQREEDAHLELELMDSTPAEN